MLYSIIISLYSVPLPPHICGGNNINILGKECILYSHGIRRALPMHIPMQIPMQIPMHTPMLICLPSAHFITFGLLRFPFVSCTIHIFKPYYNVNFAI